MGSDLNLDQIKDLMGALRESGLTGLKLRLGETELSLSREESQVCSPPPQPLPSHHHPHPLPPPSPEPATPVAPPAAQVDERQYIVSPMVGTFYQSASPDDAPFVKVGDQVSEGTVVCIVEAMKVMNEIKAGVSGTVKSMLVDNATPVEFGTNLFEID